MLSHYSLILIDMMHYAFRRSDSVVILPGGYGTLDELFEILTLILVGVHDKPIFILNSSNFYGHLIQHFDTIESFGFVHDAAKVKQVVTVLSEPSEIIPYLSKG
jgi:predicted Rossmann-fold nucleotide-binding protein